MGINEGLSYTLHCVLPMHKVSYYYVTFYHYIVYYYTLHYHLVHFYVLQEVINENSKVLLIS